MLEKQHQFVLKRASYLVFPLMVQRTLLYLKNRVASVVVTLIPQMTLAITCMIGYCACLKEGTLSYFLSW